MFLSNLSLSSLSTRFCLLPLSPFFHVQPSLFWFSSPGLFIWLALAPCITLLWFLCASFLRGSDLSFFCVSLFPFLLLCCIQTYVLSASFALLLLTMLLIFPFVLFSVCITTMHRVILFIYCALSAMLVFVVVVVVAALTIEMMEGPVNKRQ